MQFSPSSAIIVLFCIRNLIHLWNCIYFIIPLARRDWVEGRLSGFFPLKWNVSNLDFKKIPLSLYKKKKKPYLILFLYSSVNYLRSHVASDILLHLFSPLVGKIFRFNLDCNPGGESLYPSNHPSIALSNCVIPNSKCVVEVPYERHSSAAQKNFLQW